MLHLANWSVRVHSGTALAEPVSARFLIAAILVKENRFLSFRLTRARVLSAEVESAFRVTGAGSPASSGAAARSAAATAAGWGWRARSCRPPGESQHGS